LILMQSLNVGDQSVVPFQSVNIGEFNGPTITQR